MLYRYMYWQIGSQDHNSSRLMLEPGYFPSGVTQMILCMLCTHADM